MTHCLKRLPAVLILLMTPVLGVLIAIALLFLIIAIQEYGRWQTWEIPPGVTGLVTAGDGSVVVTTADGTLYEGWCGSLNPDDDCWREIDAPPEEVVFPCNGQELAPPPARTTDTITTCVSYEYSRTLTRYALLEDGTLRRWQVVYSSLGSLVLGYRLVLGALVAGLVVGIAILRWRQQDEVGDRYQGDRA